MTTYEVTAWCGVPYYTIFELDAATIEEALEKAKLQAKDESGEPCGGECDWDEFEIVSGDERVSHVEPPRFAANAAVELRDALQDGADIAQRVVDTWERGDLAGSVRDLSNWLADARVVLTQATKP